LSGGGITIPAGSPLMRKALVDQQIDPMSGPNSPKNHLFKEIDPDTLVFTLLRKTLLILRWNKPFTLK